MKEETKLKISKAITYACLIASATFFGALGISIMYINSRTQYLSQNSKIELKLEDIDKNHEGLEHLLIIEGEKYKIQQRNGNPILIKLIQYNCNPYEDSDPLTDPSNPLFHAIHG